MWSFSEEPITPGENRSDKIARAAFFHIDAQFSEELLAKLPRPLELMR
jgi:hypothetical protein